ncbi:methyltransferase [Bifidobacterium actinocoloniiforme DSM 22766]|uniref:Methyltransferase n=1 Tax=Bifidobacterium actinocoloniiforme DSM 22766 TaxID=1437605 RepID=A0A086YYF9_9BIFI|nr:class I SAM-dependent methyltransferase [Bifidobacterium actinocoloniiforme]AKV55859.1 hypothetical protein AB656_06530 [Bifidobacterium actinocoloniiforme DSM 22766]KFI39309.1 methyltransferase [Bifidobacterium actinocoloniiforme DSM 22766]
MINVFNHFYADYDEWLDTAPGALADQVQTRALLELLEPKTGQSILEVGCGTGNFTGKLAQAGCKVSGVDIALNMLDQARRKLAERKQSADLRLLDITRLASPENETAAPANSAPDTPSDLYDASAEHTPLPDWSAGSFDSAFSMACFEFLPNPAAAYRAMRRLVKPGGSIVIGTIQHGAPWANLYESPVCQGTAYEYARFLTADQLISLDPSHFTGRRDCLFIPPSLPDAAYTLAEESRRQDRASHTNPATPGGFTCVRFVASAVN